MSVVDNAVHAKAAARLLLRMRLCKHLRGLARRPLKGNENHENNAAGTTHYQLHTQLILGSKGNGRKLQ